ncbi:hypothetical protein [Alishewanella longhuensis]
MPKLSRPDLHNLTKYVALPKKQRNADFDKALGIKEGMDQQALSALIASWYNSTD